MAEKSNKHAAIAQFAKIQRASDARTATAEYETAAAAIRAKTERLKALRLARDAATPTPQAAPPKRKARKQPRKVCRNLWTARPRKAGAAKPISLPAR